MNYSLGIAPQLAASMALSAESTFYLGEATQSGWNEKGCVK